MNPTDEQVREWAKTLASIAKAIPQYGRLGRYDGHHWAHQLELVADECRYELAIRRAIEKKETDASKLAREWRT